MNRSKRPPGPSKRAPSPHGPRSSKPSGPSKSSKPSGSSKPSKPGRSSKPEYGAKPSRPGKPPFDASSPRGRASGPTKPGKPSSSSKPSKFAKPSATNADDGFDRDSELPRATKPARPSRPSRPTNPGKPSRPGNPASARFRRAEDRAERERFVGKKTSTLTISTIPLVRSELLYTTREGYEQDLIDELKLAHRGEGARLIAPSLVASPKEYVDCAFARQAMVAKTIVKADNALALDRAVTSALYELMREQPTKKWALHVWVPDSEEGNKFARVADVLAKTVPSQAGSIDAKWADRIVDSARIARDAGGLLAQVCVLGPTRAVVSAQSAVDAHSLHPGGRARMRVDNEAPSRAAMKLEEALDWFGAAPSRGDHCVDLGAAPGGWTHVLLARGAHVLAVDPGAMAPAIARHKNFEHIRGSAFEIEPEKPVDWLFCDMVWRPLEVAAMLAKWARRGWASMLVANIKLPMKQKADFVKRVLDTLRDGGWHRVRARQLYHDREEVTVCAHRK